MSKYLQMLVLVLSLGALALGQVGRPLPSGSEIKVRTDDAITLNVAKIIDKLATLIQVPIDGRSECFHSSGNAGQIFRVAHKKQPIARNMPAQSFHDFSF